MTRRPLAVALCALAVAGACGHASRAEKVAETTSRNMGKIRSGQLFFRLGAGSGTEGQDDNEVGFQLEGAFALAAPGGLPVARIDYTQLAAGHETTTQVVSTGSQAYVVLHGTAYQLPAAQVETLRAPKDGTGGHGFSGLRIEKWVETPALSPGDPVDGVPTDRIRGDVDVVRTLNDLFAFGRQAGASDLAVPEIKGDDADQLRRVTRSATVELLTGRQDRLLRKLAVDVRLAAHVPERVRQALGEVAAARIHFDVSLTRPNTPVQVAEPAGALPASALPRQGG